MNLTVTKQWLDVLYMEERSGLSEMMLKSKVGIGRKHAGGKKLKMDAIK